MSSSYETESEILAGLGKDTEDDSVNAVPQIVLGVICFRPKNKSFLLVRGPATFLHGQGTHSAKLVLIVWAEKFQMPHKISAQFVCPSPKVSNFQKKSSLWLSVVRGQGLLEFNKSRISPK